MVFFRRKRQTHHFYPNHQQRMSGIRDLISKDADESLADKQAHCDSY